MGSNYTGTDFLDYAKEDLKNGLYKTAIYLGCVASEEAAKIGDFETFVKALEFTDETRIKYSKGLRRDLLVYGIAPTNENLKEIMVSECRLVKKELRALLGQFSLVPMKKRELVGNLTEKVKGIFMDIAEETY